VGVSVADPSKLVGNNVSRFGVRVGSEVEVDVDGEGVALVRAGVLVTLLSSFDTVEGVGVGVGARVGARVAGDGFES